MLVSDMMIGVDLFCSINEEYGIYAAFTMISWLLCVRFKGQGP